MFPFQNLSVYAKAKEFTKVMYSFILEKDFGKIVNDQLQRASLSIMLNIAEGSSRISKKDSRHFFVIARGSAFECVAVLDILKDLEKISKEEYNNCFVNLEEISKMLFSLIKKLEN